MVGSFKKIYRLLLLMIFLIKLSDLQAATRPGDAEISDGSRINVKGKGFSIIPPAGWEIHTEFPNMSLLLQVPFKKGLVYQRTIQVMIIKGSSYIDDITRKKYEEILVRKFSRVTESIKNYRIRNHLLTKMSDGREGILYYAEFTLEERKMMQAHILVSSSKHSYLLTYTDLIEHFEGDESSKYLTKAWESMTSILLVGDAPVRFQKMFLFGLLIIAILILLILFYLIRHAKAGKSYSDHTHSEHLSEEDLADVNAPSMSKYDSAYQTREPPGTAPKSAMESIPPRSVMTGNEWSFDDEEHTEPADTGMNEAPADGKSEDDDDVWK